MGSGFSWGHWTERRSQEHQETREEEIRGHSVQFDCTELVSIDMLVFFSFYIHFTVFVTLKK